MDYLTRFYPSCQALVQKERKVFSCQRHFWVRSFYQIYSLTWLKLWVVSQAETIIQFFYLLLFHLDLELTIWVK